MTTIGYIGIAVLAIMAMVVVHELGHYLAGKLLGFKILEFNVGFGPPIFKRVSKKTGEIFAIRPIPLGGSCVFEEEDGESKSPTAFNNQASWKRLIVLFSGAFFNLIAALIVITFVFTFQGQILPTVDNLIPNAEGGYSTLQKGDAFLSVNGKQVNILLADDYTRLFSNTGDTITVKVLRGGKAVSLTLNKTDIQVGRYDESGNFIPELNEDGEVKTYVGFGFQNGLSYVKLNFFRAFARSFSFMFFLVFKILSILGSLLTGKLGVENAGGPITTINVLSQSVSGGLGILMYTVCIISANLAVMNLLPIPALDGARMVFCTIEWIFKKPIKKSVEAVIHLSGFFLMIMLAILLDVMHFMRN